MASSNEPIDRSWLAGGGSTDSAEVAAHYDDWAESYDASLHDWGYEAPTRVAGTLARHIGADAVILDAGCGTGLTGTALRAAGFQHIDGTDISSRSLARARQNGAYRELIEHDLHRPFPVADDRYDALQCVGVLTYVAEPRSVLREFCRVVRPGGVIAFTQRSDLFEARDFDGLLRELEDDGVWEVIERSQPAAYLPLNEDYGHDILVIYCLCRVR